MTISPASPLVIYTIAGTGPYAVPWPFQASGVVANIVPVAGTIWVALTGAQFTLSPLTGSDTTGTLVLDAAIATAYAGAKLHITRASLQSQGWQGIANTREKGVEAQLDQMTLLVQEVSAQAARALRVTGTAINPAFVTDGCSIVWNEAQRAFLPGPSATDLANAAPNAAAAAASAASASAIVGGLGSLTAAVTAAQNSAAAAAAAVGSGLLGLVKFREVAASAKTTFTITGGYTVGSEFVYLNGVLLDTSEYTATNGTTVVLGTACAISDEFRLVSYSTFSVSNTLARSSNLSDLSDLPAAQTNLGLSAFFKTLLSAASEGVLRGLLLLGWAATAPKATTLQAQTGVDDTSAMTPATTAAAIVAQTLVPALTKSFFSSGQTITTLGTITVAHGLGVAPKLLTFYIQCQTAEAGYTAGDVLEVGLNQSVSGATRPHTAVTDTTNIAVHFNGTETSCFAGGNKGTNAGISLTNANWKLFIRAFA